MADAGVGSDTGIIRRLNGVTLRSALRLALNDLDLTYVIRHQVLLITTKAEAENFEEVRAYPVGDLVRPDTDFVGEPVPRQFSKHAFGGRSESDYGTLIEVITSAVRPASWDDVGGPGRIKGLSSANSMVVPQTQEVHEEISQLLAALRAVREKQRPAVRAARRDPAPELEQADPALYLRVYDPRLYGFAYGGMGGGFFQMGGASDQPSGSMGSTAPTAPTLDELRTRAKALAEAIPKFIAVTSWEPAGGEGRVLACDGRLVVRQTDDVHRQIEHFLADFNTLASHRVPRILPHHFLSADWPNESEPRPDEAQAVIERKLAQKVELSLDNVPLDELVSRFRRDFAVETQLDNKALADAGMGNETLVNLRVKDISLESALSLVLDRLDLVHLVRNEVLFITTKSEAENSLTTRVYPVFDLVVPTDVASTERRLPYGELIDLILSNLCFDSWDETGGAGTIKGFPNCGALVVSQTDAVHRNLEQLLGSIREARQLQPPQQKNASLQPANSLETTEPESRKPSNKSQASTRPSAPAGAAGASPALSGRHPPVNEALLKRFGRDERSCSSIATLVAPSALARSLTRCISSWR